MDGESASDDELSQKLQTVGWRQATIFKPDPALDLPAHVGFDAARDYLVVCTQSCSLVSSAFDKDPHAEVLAGTPCESLDKVQASGRNYRSFHMAVEGIDGYTAIQCDINRRCFIPRKELLGSEPLYGATVTARTARDFAVWLGRYYIRPALPNELVVRVRPRKRKDGLFQLLEAALKPKKGASEPLHEDIEGVYVSWAPDEELPTDQTYDLFIRILCREEKLVEELERAFDEQFAPWLDGREKDGVKLTLAVQWVGATNVLDLQEYRKLSELDYLSGPEEVGSSYDRS
jgi:hypothetical protein